jgi:NTP pyrophosphatase (non-canonical NTP hydrolase)
MSQWNLEDGLEKALEFRRARDWEQFHRPKELAAAIAIEAGELQELFLWRDEESSEDIVEDQTRLSRLSEEIADIAIYLMFLAHDLGIDLAAAVEDKIIVNETRYTIQDHKGVAKKAQK